MLHEWKEDSMLVGLHANKLLLLVVVVVVVVVLLLLLLVKRIAA